MHSTLLPLTSTQQGIWLAEQVSETQNTYVISHCIEIKHDIDSSALQQAISVALKEADTVLSRYVDGHQEVPSADSIRDLTIDIIDFSHIENGREQAFYLMEEDTQKGIPLVENDGAPLQKQILIRINENGETLWLWYQRYHHIMLDGFSFTALTKRVSEIYNSLIHNQPISASPFTSVSDVINEESAYQASDKYIADKDFWSNYCSDMPAPTSLSSNHATHTESDSHLIQHLVPISPLQINQVTALARTIKSSNAELLMSLISAYLYRMTGQAKQVVGMPFMRRLGSVSITSVAPMVNVLPLQINLDKNMSWQHLAKEFKTSLKSIRRHQHYSAEQIQRDLNKIGDSSLYCTLINYKQFDYNLNFSGAEAITHHLATGPVEDLEFSIIVEKDKTYFELRANADKYDPTELTQHGERLSIMLTHWIASPDIALSQLPILPKNEYEKLVTWEKGRQFSPENQFNMLDIFWQQVALKPNATALVCRNPEKQEETRFTFIELGNAINQFSRFLLSEFLVEKNSVIASAMPRSANTVITMMSILNTGATYLPLDLDYPKERMDMMCEDTQPSLLISHSSLSLALNIPTINVDEKSIITEIAKQSNASLTEVDRPTPKGDDIAYVIFTSGSTGRPKGVMNTHAAMLNLLLSHQESIYQPAQRVVKAHHPDRALRAAHTHSFSFDSSWLQIFWLIQGEELYVFDEDTRRDAYAIVQEVHKIQIDAMDLPPSLLAQLFNNGLMESQPGLLKHQPSLILIGGEACPAALWKQLRSYSDLTSHNLYGPTEYTVDALRANLQAHQNPIIGRPISNTRTYILDTQLQPVPIGTVGELYISGAGLAHGYLARAELSASRFIADPFCGEAGTRMYRTGDLVRWNQTGHVEFIGRGDDQVKIRGYRVEIGEVENALSMQENVESAIVIAEAINSSHRLLAYCVIPNLPADLFDTQSKVLLEALRNNLPDYMVPSALQIMTSFPRNVSGKIDKKALPKIDIQASASSYVAPKNAQETILCQGIQNVLKLDNVGANDDFFSLGGDSISAIMLCTELRKTGYTLRPSQVFKLRIPSQMALEIKLIPNDLVSSPSVTGPNWTISQDQKSTLLLRHDNIADVAPLLPLQKGMLFETLMDSASGNYNAYTKLNFTGAVDLNTLQNALNALLTRYPQLAGAFDHESLEEPVFIIPDTQNKTLTWPLSTHDLSAYSHDRLESELDRLEQELLQTSRKTDQATGMIHAAFVNFTNDKQAVDSKVSPSSALILIIHHLVIDGWSTPLLLKSLLEAYQQELSCLAPHAASYPNVIKQLHSRDQSASLEKWQQVMQTAQPCILFEQRHDEVSEFTFSLSKEITHKLTSQLKTLGITLNVFMQSLWAHSLNILSGKEDIIFGSPVSGRSTDIPGIENQVGLFLNTLPIRVTLTPTKSLWAHLSEMQSRHINLLEHDTVGLVEIQKATGNQTLFDTLLVVENYPDNEYLDINLQGKDGHPLTISDIHNRGYSHYPLALLVLPGDEITFLIENRGALSSTEVKSLADRIQLTLETALAEPHRPLCKYPTASVQEKRFIENINNTHKVIPDLTLQKALEQQAIATPQAICLSDHHDQLTYQEARNQVKALAHRLRLQGVSSGDIVAVALPRSCHLSLAIWAVIEVGAAYLPLDLSYPDDRLSYMLEDAKPSLLITQSAQGERFNTINTNIKRFEFNHLLEINSDAKESFSPFEAVTGDHPAYLIYTSGTTGRPKGVLVSHRAIVNRILWMQHEYNLSQSDVVLQKTPCSFDVSVWEFFWAPMVGASLVMSEPEAHRDPTLLMETIEHFSVTTLHFVPSMLAIFTASIQSSEQNKQACRSLKQVFCSGEALLKAQASAFKSCCQTAQLHNLYGPTEAAVDVTYKPAYDDLMSQGQGVAIGKPVWNTQLRILDQYLRPVPIGTVGELYLCGSQLAIGYLDRPELNCVRFVADPYGEAGDRMYRTGDIVRWLTNGDVEYLGRADNQIKIRGQRIELGEIETLILKQPNIEHAIVVARTLNKNTDTTGQDNRQLVAYLTLNSPENYNEKNIQAALAEELPTHMRPIAYVTLDQLPLSANGKLDRNALPEPNMATKATRSETSRAPAIGLESHLAKLFTHLLGVENIKAEDDFFALGGHSLLAMRLAADIRKEIQQPITVGQIMVTPTVAKLAALLAQDSIQHGKDKLSKMLESNHVNASNGFNDLIYLREGQGTPLFCFYPGSGFAWQYSTLSRYLKGNYPIIGLQSPRPDGLIASSNTLEELIEKQLTILHREQPQGPYYLLGYSLGGTVAYGVAAKLREAGETVNFLGLLDTYPAEVHDWNDPEGEEAAIGAEREQSQLLTNAIAGEETEVEASVKQEQEQMLAQIFANYKDAVRLLKKASTPQYDSKMNVFIAEQSLPSYIEPKKHWKPYVNDIIFHPLPYCSHENILSPDNLKVLGPLLDQLIKIPIKTKLDTTHRAELTKESRIKERIM